MSGPMGFFESLDYTREKTRRGGRGVIVYAYMAHHQGMSLMALCNFLNQSSIQKWFHREPRVMAAELLLHEKVGLSVPVKSEAAPDARGKRSTRRLLRSAAASSPFAHA